MEQSKSDSSSTCSVDSSSTTDSSTMGTQVDQEETLVDRMVIHRSNNRSKHKKIHIHNAYIHTILNNHTSYWANHTSK